MNSQQTKYKNQQNSSQTAADGRKEFAGDKIKKMFRVFQFETWALAIKIERPI